MNSTKGSFAASLIGLSALACHASPALSAIGPLRTKIFKRLSGISDSRSIALTFDDGPDKKSTPLFLNKLDKLGYKATFFMLGSMAEKDPSLTKEVSARGHEIALHGYEHKNLLWRTPKATARDIKRGFEVLEDVTGTRPTFYRPPYGVLNAQALATAKELSLTPILWTAWGRDWRARATPQSVLNDLSPGLKAGTTLLLHDSDCTSADNSYLSALGAIELLGQILEMRDLTIERLCDHF